LEERSRYTDTVRDVLGDWIEAHEGRYPPTFVYRIGPGFVQITDTRAGDGRYVHLADMHADVILLCDKVQKLEWLEQMLAPVYPGLVADGAVRSVVDDLLQLDVLMAEGPFLLTLPTAYRPRTTIELYKYVLGEYAPPMPDGPRGSVPMAFTSRPRIPVGAGAE
jgi:hypothetical protein